MSQSYLHRFTGHTGFNAHHSPMGAFFSFTCGHTNAGGGMAVQSGRPAAQDIFVGMKDGDRMSDAPLRCLPLFSGAKDAAAEAYQIEQAKLAPSGRMPVAFPADQVQRFYGWASDRWTAPGMQFTIYTPFGPIPDPVGAGVHELREALMPAIVAEFTIDNSTGAAAKTGVFAIRFPEKGLRILPGMGDGRLGFAVLHQMGFAGQMLDQDGPAAFPILRWTPDEALLSTTPVHHIGNCPGIAFDVPAGQKRTLRLAIGCYLDGVVTTGIEAKYYYTRLYSNLEDVLSSALDNYEMMVVRSSALDHELAKCGLSLDQQFLIAHATRSYYGSTQLLDLGGHPFWVVNEGEYRMLNTLDLAVDHVFWELRQNPWVVRNLLAHFAKFYSFRDHVKVSDGNGGTTLVPAGLSFTHDMGVNNAFSPLGTSSYELAELDALCFSHMTQEQLCNWTLIAGCYTAVTEDMDWLNEYEPMINDCLSSMLNRDHVDPGLRIGVMQLDSSRCGTKGSEITTYDSLDHSLAQARNNLYIGTKCWATYLALAMMFEKLGDTNRQDHAIAAASRAARTIAGQMGPEGFIPAVFEKNSPGHNARILPAVEGLVYPLYWRDMGQKLCGRALDPSGPFTEMLSALHKHAQTLVEDPQDGNRFADGGIRLSSTSGNSWMSKIAIFQHVCREYLSMENGDARQKAADAAHVKWQTEGESAFWAMSDQIVNGVAQGSKYYPRCVTTALWLK